MISHYNLPRKKRRIGKWILLIVIIALAKFFFLGGSVNLHETVIIQKGDTFQKFTNDFSSIEKLKIKIYLMTHKNFNLGKIQGGSYIFSGNYSFNTFLTQIAAGPTQNFIRYTVLEGWNIYDIDADLTAKGYITGGEYIALASDPTIIAKYKTRYDFLAGINLPSLEGFLYPDTYHIDVDKNFSDQLIYMQLEAFKSKVWIPYSGQFIDLNSKLQFNGLNLTSFAVNPYKIVTLASVVEKEVNGDTNKPTVAGIFLKRLSIGMGMGSDVTLCYGLKQPFATCTPTIIAQNINDKSNIFNTRVHGGLPPQPISNPSVSTIAAVLNFQPSNYLFFLYGTDGLIHYATTNAQHEANKQQYMK